MQPERHEDSHRPAGGVLLAGTRELARILRRQAHRAALALEARRLRKAETHLGWLGWQQADFNEEHQAYVEEINRFEKEQGDLLNEHANIASTIAALQLEQTETESEAVRQLDQIAAERIPLAEARDIAAKRFTEKQAALNEAQKKMADADAEEKPLARRLGKLGKTFPPPEDLREQLRAIETRRAAIQNAKPILQQEITALLTALKPLEADLKLRKSRLSTLDKKTKKLRATQASAARKLRRQIHSAERWKTTMERQTRKLEKQKKLPFLKVGRVLADSGISPMNQPEALQAVLAHREKIQRREQAIAESLAASRSVDRKVLGKFYMLLSAIVAILAAATVWMAYHAR